MLLVRGGFGGVQGVTLLPPAAEWALRLRECLLASKITRSFIHLPTPVSEAPLASTTLTVFDANRSLKCMTRSKRASGRAAKRKSAISAGRRIKSSLGYASTRKTDADDSQTWSHSREALQTLRYENPNNYSTNRLERGIKDMRFVPSSQGRAFESHQTYHSVNRMDTDLASLATEAEAYRSSPTPSNSSEEVIVFSGRGNVDDKTRLQSHSTQDIRKGEATRHEEDYYGPENEKLALEISGRADNVRAESSSQLAWVSTGDNWVHREDRVAGHLRRLNGATPGAAGKTRAWPQNGTLGVGSIPASTTEARGLGTRVEHHEDAASADYLTNLQKWQPDIARIWSTATNTFNSWTKSDLEDFDDLSTSDDIREEVEQVLSKRYRNGAKQYLVVWKDQSIDEARWIPDSSLTMESARHFIQSLEDHEKIQIDGDDSEGDVASAERETGDQSIASLSSESDGDDQNDRDAKNERLMHQRMAKMTDEQLARLYTKQEELGIHADELLIFDGEVDDEEYSDGTYEDQDVDQDDNGNVLANSDDEALARSLLLARRQARPGFADGALDALKHDDYGDFDIMDFDRPSLFKGKHRARHEVPSFGLSDEELERNIQSTWAADRDKKRLKKRERESLRAQGLLGKKNSVKPDMKAKYSSGLSVEDFRSQLEEFLESDHTTLALPPMDKKDRKTIHTIVNYFNLRSKSQGSGKSRFPIVYKTTKTSQFSDHLFDRISSKLGRQFFPRMDKSKSKPNASAKNAAAPSGVSYGHGDTVGAGAPELGVENRGRAMLEKMGWTKGDALGAIDNQGILQPIAHVVRKSRVGLG